MKKTTGCARFNWDYPLCAGATRRMQRQTPGIACFANDDAVFQAVAVRRAPTTNWVEEAFFERRCFIPRSLARA